jgi:hypothetical protein
VSRYHCQNRTEDKPWAVRKEKKNNQSAVRKEKRIELPVNRKADQGAVRRERISSE